MHFQSYVYFCLRSSLVCVCVGRGVGGVVVCCACVGGAVWVGVLACRERGAFVRGVGVVALVECCAVRACVRWARVVMP